MHTSSLSRRHALRRLASLGVVFAAPAILPSSLFGKFAPSKKVNVGMIGVGRQGQMVNLRTFLGMPEVRVVAVCDVDRQRLGFAGQMVRKSYGGGDCREFTDFRELLEMGDLDAVMVSTPDHWHAIPALAAMKKGLHVSLEKPFTRYLEDGRLVADLAKKSGVVLRTDSECRSNSYMVKVADLAMNGYLGKILRFEVGVPREAGGVKGNPVPMAVPGDLDYEMWQGPAALRPYTLDRVHPRFNDKGEPVGRPGWFRCSDYSAGMICNWGAHLLDVANLINGTEHSGPVSVEGRGRFAEKSEDNLWDTIVDFQVQYKYANGVSMDCRMERPFLKVIGESGWIEVNWGGARDGIQASDPKLLTQKLKAEDHRVSRLSDKKDFITAIREGTPVMIDAETGHRVNSQGLIGLAAVRCGKRLDWDPATEKFANDPAANELLKGTHRSPWLPERFL